MSRGRAGRLCTLAPAALAPEVRVRWRSMASTSCDSISVGSTRLRQASSCICRRLGRLPRRHALGSSPVAPESSPASRPRPHPETTTPRSTAAAPFRALSGPASPPRAVLSAPASTPSARSAGSSETRLPPPVPTPCGGGGRRPTESRGPCPARLRGSAATAGAHRLPYRRWRMRPARLPLRPGFSCPVRSKHVRADQRAGVPPFRLAQRDGERAQDAARALKTVEFFRSSRSCTTSCQGLTCEPPRSS